jgi:uncharacterized LabA/DUF88 family protein
LHATNRKETPLHRVRAYIDGFNLYYGMHSAFARQYLWLDLEELSRSLLHPGQELDLVHYFTAPMRSLTPSRHRQDTYIQALQAHCGRLTIVHGRFQERNERCRACGVTRVTYEEKETDVSIAVALVEDAARAAFDTALLVSGDSDLCPAVRAARRLAPRGRFISVFPPLRRSDPLRVVSDGVYSLGRDKLRRAQLPDKVVTSGGIVLERPPHWA